MRSEQIAFVTHGFDAVWFGGVIQQLFTQARNGHVHAAIHTVVAHAAQVFQQSIAIHNLSSVGGKLPQQVKISGREGNIHAGK
ncbi:hypothetical protein D3C86_1781630 [compost metagenome]